MTELVRCPACRGAKKVAKIGGMKGDCNLCKGKGSVLGLEKVEIKEPVKVEPVAELISQVADCVPSSTVTPSDIVTLPVEPQIKIDPKRTIYKRKK